MINKFNMNNRPRFSTAVVCISCVVDNIRRDVFFDTIEDSEITLSSTLTTQPLVNGEMTADHMYNEAPTMSISGAFSINGGTLSGISVSGAKLSDIQSFFEKIKSNGILCTITKYFPNDSNHKDIRFKKRDNMVINNIVWKEGINTLNFSFTFTQILLIEKKKYISDEEYIPDTVDLIQLNFSDTLINKISYEVEIFTLLRGYGIVTKKFLDYWLSLDTDKYKSLKSAIINKNYKDTKYLKFDIGLIFRDTNRYSQFKLYLSSELNEQEVRRFESMLDKLDSIFEQINSAIRVYQINSNIPQTCMLSIGSDIYYFSYNLSNVDGLYYLDIQNSDGSNVKTSYAIHTSPISFTTCDLSNKLFVTNDGLYVYSIANVSDKLDSDLTKWVDYTEDDIKSLFTNLTNYYIVVSTIIPKEFNDKFSEILSNFLRK